MSFLLDGQTNYASMLVNNQAQAKAAQAAGNAKNRSEMEKVAEDFESFFLAQMFQHMSSGIETNSMFGGGHAEEMLRSLLIDEYGKLAARAGRGVGLADALVREMMKLQEVQDDELADLARA